MILHFFEIGACCISIQGKESRRPGQSRQLPGGGLKETHFPWKIGWRFPLSYWIISTGCWITQFSFMEGKNWAECGSQLHKRNSVQRWIGCLKKIFPQQAGNSNIMQKIWMFKKKKEKEMHVEWRHRKTLEARRTRGTLSALWMRSYGWMVECVLCVSVRSTAQGRLGESTSIEWARKTEEMRRGGGEKKSWRLRKTLPPHYTCFKRIISVGSDSGQAHASIKYGFESLLICPDLI